MLYKELRVALKNDKQLQMRVDDAFLQKIDEWRHAHKIPTRADAIRKLVEAGMRIPDAADNLLSSLPDNIVAYTAVSAAAMNLRRLLDEHFQGVNNAAEAQIRDLLNRVVHGQEFDVDDLYQTLEWVKQSSLELQPGESLLAKAAEMKESEGKTNAAAKVADVLRNSIDAKSVAGGGLSDMTGEIVAAFDDTAMANAWARYQAGEASPFSRRIYSQSGQETFDKVRRRLQVDAEFARNAQAYMGDFEDLLKRATAGANVAAEVRELLLSDRGKVYTALAHASGRLGS